ncbi:undecaprenyl-phosphate glucose phosphotransferase [Lutibacter citreus]|uniref:undecaprenyl-phosphate glucose phosphotransferase n=1 Tax=Lutibacter citreus TaxID=2138210 RepID=UPI000DBE1F7F|nr:undecaprenyl-phosphate glucose phosphotransferase [Lutibacter citreus]
MPKGRIKYLPIPAFLINALLLCNAFLTAGYIVFNGVNPLRKIYVFPYIGALVLWGIITVKLKMYDFPRIIHMDKIVSKTVYGIAVFAMISAAFLYVGIDYKFSREFFLITIVSFGIMLICWHMMLVVVFKAYRKKGYNVRNVIILGYNIKIEQLIKDVLLEPENGYKLQYIFSDTEIPKSLQPYFKGTEAELIPYLESNQADSLFISLPANQSYLINKYISYADNNLIRVNVMPNFTDYLSQKFYMNYIDNLAFLGLRKEPLESMSSRITKRIFDIFFAIFVLVFIGVWLFPLLAILIKLNSKGPIFFSQMRSGKDGEAFKCLKFRSMTVNTDSDSLQASKNDARITSIGKILRKTSLDEMPQFFNVLIGNMSVVGPRPHMLAHTDSYKQSVHKFMVRHFAKPGITGWAQVKGFRGETKEIKDMANRAEADIWYIENWTLMLDIKIIVLTAWQVFIRGDKNAF